MTDPGSEFEATPASTPWLRAKRLLRPILWVAALPLALVLLVPLVLVALITKQFEKPLVRTRDEVAEILEARVAPDGDGPIWDEFVDCEIADPELEAIRKECLELEPLAERGVARIRELVLWLRLDSTASAPPVN